MARRRVLSGREGVRPSVGAGGVTPTAVTNTRPSATSSLAGVPNPGRSRYQPNITNIYGTHHPYNVGYGVTTPDRQAGSGRHANDWNAQIIDQKNRTIELWIEDFSTSFEMNGSMAQSRYHRQFFPRNFVQPTLTLQGRVANSYEYNRLSSFVRESHYYALRANETNDVLVHSADGVVVFPTITLRLRRGGLTGKRNIKGQNNAWSIDGYIKAMPAGAKHFDTAPQFQFDFVIAESAFTPGTVGIYKDDLVAGTQILSWMDIFEKNRFADEAASTKANAAAVTAATQAAGNLGAFVGTLFSLFNPT